MRLPFRFHQLLFFLAAGFSLSPWMTPPLALAMGMAFVQLWGHPFAERNKAWTSALLKIMVVGLGLGMPLNSVVAAGAQGLGMSLAVLVFVFGLGYLLGRWMGLDRGLSHLVSSGTAICGGSAIAAVAPLVPIDGKGLSLSLGIVFLLNALALFLFPQLGLWMGLDPVQFGQWAALAIHDTSSVVGAASRFDQALGGAPGAVSALDIAVTTKLSRTLWIIPLSLVTAWMFGSRGGGRSFPYFLLFFLGAVLLYSLGPAGRPLFQWLASAARQGLQLCLFLIGMGLSWPLLRSLGGKLLGFGFLLWLAVSGFSLLLVLG